MEHRSPGPSCDLFKISRKIRYRVLYNRVRLLAFGAHLARPVVCSFQKSRKMTYCVFFSSVRLLASGTPLARPVVCSIQKNRKIRYRVLYSAVRLLASGAPLARPVVCSLQNKPNDKVPRALYCCTPASIWSTGRLARRVLSSK